MNSVGEVVGKYWELRAELYSPPSPIGYQLENARLGLHCSPNEASMQFYDPNDNKHERYADVFLLLRDLTETELLIIGVLYCGVTGHETYTRTVSNSDLQDLFVGYGEEQRECRAVLQNGHECRRKRAVGFPRCWQHIEYASQPVTKITYSGEEFVSVSDLSEDMSVVFGVKAKRPSIADLASALSVSSDELRRFVKRISQKIQNRIDDRESRGLSS